MKQIWVIHGGDAFERYEDYLASLKNKKVSLETLRSEGWKKRLGKDLGDGYDVFKPRMPNNQNARYLEWRIWFEKLIPLMNEEVIFVGHSLGGIFLAKYLSETSIPKKIRATFLVGAPFNTASEHPLVDFILEGPLTRFAQQGGSITILHSRDDQVVPYSNAERYARELPHAKLVSFDGRGHFTDEEFPEIVQLIRDA